MKLKEFKTIWTGRRYKCLDTGEVITITADMAHPRAFIKVGNGAVDLGDGFYSRRVGNIEEIKL